MKRRTFLAASALAGMFAHTRNNRAFSAMINRPLDTPLPRRRYNGDVDLSVVGFGAIVIMGMDQGEANGVVAEAVDGGINYFDVAPSYGDGEAEEKLGPALEPHRKKVFLACKTMERDARGAAAELNRSLKRLKTDHVDLYQFHAVTEMEEVDQIFAPGGACEAFVKAREVELAFGDAAGLAGQGFAAREGRVVPIDRPQVGLASREVRQRRNATALSTGAERDQHP